MKCKVLPTGLFMIILSSLILAGALSGCGTSGGGSAGKRETLYERVTSTGKLRCGYVVYSPGCLKDPNSGQLSGIGIDSLRQVGKKLGLTIEFVEEVGWGTMLEGLQTGRYDMIATPIWTNSARARLVGFSNALYYSPICAYVKKGVHKFDHHLESINSPTVTIATVDGETGQVIADADFPKANRLSLPQMSDVAQDFLNVADGKADVCLAEPAIANKFMKANKDDIEMVECKSPVRIFPNCWMFKRGEFEFKSMIDAVLAEILNDGTMEKTIRAYEPDPGVLYRVAPPYQSPSQR